MATVTGLTAARMLEIEAASVVSGTIDTSGHLILSTHDGTQIDAGYALVAVPDASDIQKGVVELATDSETVALTDANKAVTPSSLNSTINSLNSDINDLNTGINGLDSRIDTLESKPPPDPATLGMTGEIRMWSSHTIPSGWRICDGSAISRTTFSSLFSVIGTTYGVGDSSTTFNVPDMRGRVPAGYDSAQSEFNTLGKVGGAKTHVLTTAEMPSHTHIQDAHTHAMTNGSGALSDGSGSITYIVQNGSAYGFRITFPASTTATNQNTGGGGPHNNLQPYFTIRYIIKL